MRIVTSRPSTPAGRTGRSIALALAVALAAGCDAEPESTDRADAPGTTAPDGDEDGGATVPSRFQGSYAADQAACDAPGNPTQLDIEAGSISFHESSGPVTAVSGGPSDITITAEVTGEGETREATYTFRLSEDGRTLTDRGGGMERVRCN